MGKTDFPFHFWLIFNEAPFGNVVAIATRKCLSFTIFVSKHYLYILRKSQKVSRKNLSSFMSYAVKNTEGLVGNTLPQS